MTDADYIAMEKSTIVRSGRRARLLPLARQGNRALSALAPALAARLAERLFLTPPLTRRPAAEIDLLATARARPMHVGARRIETWVWGSGPRVLLVHGWGGRGAQLGALVGPLVARGFSVVTFDAPGHGASDSGLVTIPEMIGAIRAVAASRGPLAGLIAHSVGAGGGEGALRGPRSRRRRVRWRRRRPDWARGTILRDPGVLARGARSDAPADRGARRSALVGLRRDHAGAGAGRAASRDPRPGRCRGALAARHGDHPGLARSRHADDRGAGTSSNPARSRCGGGRGGVPDRPRRRARRRCDGRRGSAGHAPGDSDGGLSSAVGQAPAVRRGVGAIAARARRRGAPRCASPARASGPRGSRDRCSRSPPRSWGAP